VVFAGSLADTISAAKVFLVVITSTLILLLAKVPVGLWRTRTRRPRGTAARDLLFDDRWARATSNSIAGSSA
jgi:hypothetical protein